jgi:hypothetical protein
MQSSNAAASAKVNRVLSRGLTRARVRCPAAPLDGLPGQKPCFPYRNNSCTELTRLPNQQSWFFYQVQFIVKGFLSCVLYTGNISLIHHFVQAVLLPEDYPQA